MYKIVINGVDYTTNYGVRMGLGFRNSLLAPLAFKDDIENDSALEDGIRMVLTDKVASREITLTFYIGAKGERNATQNADAFVAELNKRKVVMKIDGVSTEIFRLVYTGKNVTYKRGNGQHTITAKFIEPNPANRGAESIDSLFGS